MWLLWTSLSLLPLASPCDLFLAPSAVSGAGMGLFAGRSFAAEEVLAVDESLLLRTDDCYGSQLNNYIFGTDDDAYANLNLGVITLMNHRLPKNTQGYLAVAATPAMLTPRAAHSVYPPVVLMATEPVRAGSELFTSYGGSDWFVDRGIQFSDQASSDEQRPASRPLHYLQEEGYCLTDVEVKKSGIYNAGRGLFARRRFSAGDLVTLSPALVLPMKRLRDAAPHSVVLNYAISPNDSDVAILPFGRGAMANHGEAGQFNLQLQWHDREMGTAGAGPNGSSTGKDELQQSDAAPVYVSYVATRDIATGDELTLHYGKAWEQAWTQYARRMNAAVDRGVASPPASSSIIFRHPIGAPEGMFPSHWSSDKGASASAMETANDL